MALQVVLGQQVPLVVTVGATPLPGTIRPDPAQASLADFMYSTFSQSLRTQLVKSATPRRIEIQGTVGLPVFVSVGGRWGKVASTVFADSALTGIGYIFVVVNADGTLSLRLSASSVAGAFELLAGSYNDNGALIRWINLGLLGLATDITGLLSLGGASGGLRVFDRTLGTAFFNDIYANNGDLIFADKDGSTPLRMNTNNIDVRGSVSVRAGLDGLGATLIPGFVMWDQLVGIIRNCFITRNNDVVSFIDSQKGTILTLSNTGALTAAALSNLTVPGTFKSIVTQSANILVADGTINAGGQLFGFDKNAHAFASQSAVPTLVAGTGAGTAPTVAVLAGSTDQSGVLQITTGTAPAGTNAILATISFKTAMAAAPHAIIVQPANVAAINLARNQDCLSSRALMTVAQWVLATGTAALAASTAYEFQYWVL